MAFRLTSKIVGRIILYRRCFGTGVEQTRLLRFRLCVLKLQRASGHEVNSFRRFFRTRTPIAQSNSDIRRLFGLARPEALRIVGMMSDDVLLSFYSIKRRFFGLNSLYYFLFVINYKCNLYTTCSLPG